ESQPVEYLRVTPPDVGYLELLLFLGDPVAYCITDNIRHVIKLFEVIYVNLKTAYLVIAPAVQAPDVVDVAEEVGLVKLLEAGLIDAENGELAHPGRIL